MSNLSEQVDIDELQKIFDQTLNDKTSDTKEPVASAVVENPEQVEKPSETDETKAEEAKVDKVEDTQKPTATENQWLESLPAEAKKHFDSLEAERQRLLNNWKIEQGRTAKALREQRETQQRLDQAKQRQEQAPVAAKENERVKELLASLEESDPAMAELLKAVMDDTLNKAKTEQDAKLEHIVDQQVRPIHQAEEARYVAQQKQIMDTECPNWVDVMRSPDFVDYMKGKPKFMQEAYHSDNAEDLLQLLRTYSYEVFGPAEAATPAKGGDPTEAQKLEQRRNEKLQKSVVPSSAPTKQRGSQLSEEEELQKLFDKAYKGEI